MEESPHLHLHLERWISQPYLILVLMGKGCLPKLPLHHSLYQRYRQEGNIKQVIRLDPNTRHIPLNSIIRVVATAVTIQTTRMAVIRVICGIRWLTSKSSAAEICTRAIPVFQMALSNHHNHNNPFIQSITLLSLRTGTRITIHDI